MSDLPCLTNLDSDGLVQFLRNHSVKEWNFASISARAKNPLWCADLRAADLCHLNLRWVDFQGANLEGSHLLYTDMRGATLTQASLTDANIKGANLNKAVLMETSLQSVSACEAELREADLKEADLRYANFENADFRGAKLRNARLDQATFHGADCRAADFQGSNVSDTDFHYATFGRSDFSVVRIWEAKLDEAHIDLTGDSQIANGQTTDSSMITLDGNCKPVGFIKESPIIVFSTRESPGYVISYQEWAGLLPDLTDHMKDLLAPNTPGFRQFEAMIPLIKTVVSEWGVEVEIQSTQLLNSDDSITKLQLEAKRTGQSPVDILLGD